jgi:hypothetical protein
MTARTKGFGKKDDPWMTWVWKVRLNSMQTAQLPPMRYIGIAFRRWSVGFIVYGEPQEAAGWDPGVEVIHR